MKQLWHFARGILCAAMLLSTALAQQPVDRLGYTPGFNPGLPKTLIVVTPPLLTTAQLSTTAFPSSAAPGTILAAINNIIVGSTVSITSTDTSGYFAVSGTNLLAGPSYPTNATGSPLNVNVILTQTDAGASNNPLTNTIPATIAAAGSLPGTYMLTNATAATGQVYYSNTINFLTAGTLHLNCAGLAANIVAMAEPLDVSGLSWDAPTLTCSANGNNQGAASITANTPMRVLLYNGIPIHASGNVGNGSIGYTSRGPTQPEADYPYYDNLVLFGNFVINFISPTTYTETDPNGATVAGTGTVGTFFNPMTGVAVGVVQGSTPWATGDQITIPATAPAMNVNVSLSETQP